MSTRKLFSSLPEHKPGVDKFTKCRVPGAGNQGFFKLNSGLQTHPYHPDG